MSTPLNERPLLECGCRPNGLIGVERKSGCVSHGCTTPMKQAPDLENRVAKCSDCGRTVPSTGKNLAFFTFRGEGSRDATISCQNCGYLRVAHDKETAPKWEGGKTAVEVAGCPGFEPHGPYEFDTFYCGCEGWD